MSFNVKPTNECLPPGWKLTTLGESCRVLAGFGFPERLQGRTQGEIPFFKVGDISAVWKRNERFLNDAKHYISYADASSIRARPLPANTIVFAKIGAAIALNRRAMLGTAALVDNNIMGLSPSFDNLDARFLFHYVCTLKLDELSRATTVPSVRKSDIENISLPLPPVFEQRCIVAEIEKQFTRLDAGVASLKRVQAALKRYCASVLKAACEGRLVATEAELARKEGRSYEPATELLTRILRQRRTEWESVRAAKCQTTGKGQYEETRTPEVSGEALAMLPEGWTWASLGQLIGYLRNGISTKPDAEDGLPILRISAVRPLSVNLSDVRFLGESQNNFADYLLANGDLLFTRYNGNPELVGVCAMVHGLTYPLVHPDKLIRAKLVSPGALPSFVSVVANVGISRRYLAKRVRTTAGQAGISGGDLKGIPIPLPPSAEQKRIVEEVERRISVIVEIEATVKANLKRAERLRQSILHRAFTGNL